MSNFVYVEVNSPKLSVSYQTGLPDSTHLLDEIRLFCVNEYRLFCMLYRMSMFIQYNSDISDLCGLRNSSDIQSSHVITYSQGVGKKYVVTIVRYIRTENFSLREMGTWNKVRYNGGYVVNGVRCNDSTLYPDREFSIT